MANIELLPIEVDGGNQSILVSTNVEYNQVADEICVRKNPT